MHCAYSRSLQLMFDNKPALYRVTVEFNDPSYNFPVILEPGFIMANFLHGLQHLNSMNMRRVHVCHCLLFSYRLPQKTYSYSKRPSHTRCQEVIGPCCRETTLRLYSRSTSTNQDSRTAASLLPLKVFSNFCSLVGQAPPVLPAADRTFPRE